MEFQDSVFYHQPDPQYSWQVFISYKCEVNLMQGIEHLLLIEYSQGVFE